METRDKVFIGISTVLLVMVAVDTSVVYKVRWAQQEAAQTNHILLAEVAGKMGTMRRPRLAYLDLALRLIQQDHPRSIPEEVASFLLTEDIMDPENPDLEKVQDFLSTLDLDSKVTFRTIPADGAYIAYQLITSDKLEGVDNPTKTEATIPVGIYYIWSERGGLRTSDRLLKTIIRERLRITIPER